MEQHRTPLSRLAATLKERTGNPGPGYRTAYNLALDGRLPVVVERGRMYIRDADLPEAARALGVNFKAPKHAA